PVVTIIAVSMPRVVGASTVVETVFAYPGMGRFLYTSIMGNDYVVAMTVVMIIAVTVVGFNLIADIVYGWLDPRIRYQSLKRCLARSRRPGIGGSFGSAASATGLPISVRFCLPCCSFWSLRGPTWLRMSLNRFLYPNACISHRLSTGWGPMS